MLQEWRDKDKLCRRKSLLIGYLDKSYTFVEIRNIFTWKKVEIFDIVYPGSVIN